MGERYPKVRVGVVQGTAVFLDREASTDKALAFIAEAGQKGVDLLAFPEGFIPAYPVWYHFTLTLNRVVREIFRSVGNE